MASYLGCYFGGWDGGLRSRLSKKPSMTVYLKSESTVIHTTAKVAFMPFTVSGSIDPGHPHGLQSQQLSQTSAWSLVAV